MSDFVLVDVSVLASTSSDYSDPKFKPSENQALTDQRAQRIPVLATTAGITVALGPLGSTVNYLFIKNCDSTNFVDVDLQNATSGAAIAQRLQAGEMLLLPDIQIAAGVGLTADTANCECVIVTAMT